MEWESWLAAFCAALKTVEKKPPGPVGAVNVPPGVLDSSMWGVSGEAVIVLESLLEVRVPVLFRLRVVEFSSAGLEGTEVGGDFASGAFVFGGLVDAAGSCGRVGVGGVTKVVGVLTRFGGVEGVMMRGFGPGLNLGVEGAEALGLILSIVVWGNLSVEPVVLSTSNESLLFLPPNRLPSPPLPLPSELGESESPAGLGCLRGISEGSLEGGPCAEGCSCPWVGWKKAGSRIVLLEESAGCREVAGSTTGVSFAAEASVGGDAGWALISGLERVR